MRKSESKFIKKVVVIGGGSSYTPELIDGFIKRSDQVFVGEIHLVDIELGKSKMEVVAKLSRRMIEKNGMKTKIITTLNRKEALINADFVITQFRVGGLKAREKDEKIPLENGFIGQETTGAGGFAKAMRTIPVMMEICKEIKEVCPETWLINFTNPAGIVTEAVHKFGGVKVLGLCNVPINMVRNVAKILEVDYQRVFIEFVGLNHMVWGRKIYLDDKDVTERVIDLLCNGNSITMKNIPDLQWDSQYLKALKFLPCPYHRYFYMTDEMIEEEEERFKSTNGTRAEQVMKIEKNLFEIYGNTELKEKPEELANRGGAYYSDAAVSLLTAIACDKEEIHTVNIKNNGLLSELSDTSVIEVNAVIGSHGAKPLLISGLEPQINGLIQSVKSYEELTIIAALSRKREDALLALTSNPLVTSVSKANGMLDELVDDLI